MGELDIRGKDSLKLLQKAMTNDMSKLVDGKAMYSTMCNMNGGTVDDCFIYRFSDDRYMVVTNASNTDKDLSWLQSLAAGIDVQITDMSARMGKIDLQGPLSEKILSAVCDSDVSVLKRFHFAGAEVCGKKAIISRTGYTGEDGFEIYTASEDAPHVWTTLLETGREDGLLPCGLGARDTLRTEACYSLYGHEISDTITPKEAGLSWQVKMEKDFIGKTALQKLARRRLICFEMLDRSVPRPGHLVRIRETDAGHVTSGTFSPTFRKGIGMALVEQQIESGEEITIMIRDRAYQAKVVDRPFYKFNGGKDGNTKRQEVLKGA